MAPRPGAHARKEQGQAGSEGPPTAETTPGLGEEEGAGPPAPPCTVLAHFRGPRVTPATDAVPTVRRSPGLQ